MSFWTDTRDALEGGAVAAGNYLLPGSALVTSRLVSDGAKQALQSNIGQLALLGGGIAGGMNGNMSNYSGLSDMFNSGATPGPTGTELNTTTTGADQLNTGTAAQATPAVMPGTVSQGSNLVDTTAGPINPSAPNSAYFAGQDAQDAAMGTITPQANPGFLPSLMSGNFGDAASAAGNWAAKNPIGATYAAGSLYDMYAKNQMAKKQNDLYAQNRADIMNMYAPGSAEYNSLMNEMSRKDAAAGRNSQYGARAVDLAGKIANYKTTALANMASGQNTLANSAMGNQFGMFNTPLTLAALTATQKG